MRIGIVGPVSTESVWDLLGPERESLPVGHYGAPLMGTLIQEMIARGHRVCAFTTSPGLSTGLEETVVGRGHNFTIHYAPLRPRAFSRSGGQWGRAADFFRRERDFITRAIATENVDVVHAHWSYEFAQAAMDTGLPHLVTCHDAPQVVLRYAPDLYRLVRFFMAKDVLARAKAVTAVSPYLKDLVQGYARVPVQVVPNPIPASSVSAVAKQEISDPSAPRIALILNGWGKLKNPEVAFQAFRMVRSAAPGAELFAMGKGYGDGEAAQIWARANDLHHNVHFLGPMKHQDLMQQLGTMDILVHPSLEETFGMSIAEAMALGVVVVGGKYSGAVPDTLSEGECGVVVDVRSAREIADAVIGLVKSDERYARLAKAAARKVKTQYSPDAVVSTYEALYLASIRAQSSGRALSSAA